MLCSYPPSSPHELHATPTLSPPLPSPRIGHTNLGLSQNAPRALGIITACSSRVISPYRATFQSPLASTTNIPLSAKRPRIPSPPPSPSAPKAATLNGSSPPKRLRTGDPPSADAVVAVQRKTVRFCEPPARQLPYPRLLIVTTMLPSPSWHERSDSEMSTSGSSSNAISAATVTPSLLQSIQKVKLGSSPPEGEQPSRSSPILAPGMTMKRSNPKGLSLSLASSFHATTEGAPAHSSSVAESSTSASSSRASQTTQTPSTPGAPRTPAPGASGSWGRSSAKEGRRPSLLSLITHPPGNDSTIPPTPGYAPYAATSRVGHTRNGSAGAQMAAFANYSTEMEPRGSQSAYPALRGAFSPIDERQPNRFALNVPGSSSSVSTSSASDSISSTPSTSPPGASGDEHELSYSGGLCLPAVPYNDGPIEVIPGVWLGAEDSLWSWNVWAKQSSKVTIVNVAQEIENPFDPDTPEDAWEWTSTGKAKVALTEHDSASHPAVEYAHLRWSHGEGGLADLPGEAHLENVVSGKTPCGTRDKWRFWEAIRWLEIRRRAGIPIMIHCQCGVSRSATLAVAYVMTLAAAGLVPSVLGHLRTMQDAYDYVKNKSPWIGPNVSLVFQLVEYARNLSSLLSAHVTAGAKTWNTQWPTLVDIESEDAWARRRQAFGEDADVPEEARALDEAMVARKRRE